MEKIKLGVIFGGMSTENEVSIVSASYVLSNLIKDKKIFMTTVIKIVRLPICSRVE